MDSRVKIPRQRHPELPVNLWSCLLVNSVGATYPGHGNSPPSLSKPRHKLIQWALIIKVYPFRERMRREPAQGLGFFLLGFKGTREVLGRKNHTSHVYDITIRY